MRRSLLLLWLLGCSDAEPAPTVAPVGPPAGMNEIEWGELLYETTGCFACHRIDGGSTVGPPLDGLAGDSRTLVDGRTVVADADYLRRAITDPDADRVTGFGTRPMPAYDFEAAQLDALVAYLQSLSVLAR